MHALVRTIFARLHFLDPVSEEAKLQIIDEDPLEGEIKLTVSGAGVPTEPTTSDEHQEANIAYKSEEDAEIPAKDEKEATPDDIASLEDVSSAAPKPECEFSPRSNSNL